jgi:hypothetical protein
MTLPPNPQNKVVLEGELPKRPYKEIPVKPLANVQANIAYALLWIFALTLAAAFVSVDTGWVKITSVPDFVTPFITAQVGLLGAVMGFYFATHEHGPDQSSSSTPGAKPAPVTAPHTHPTGGTGGTGGAETPGVTGPTGV